jgi:hypothetical protein
MFEIVVAYTSDKGFENIIPRINADKITIYDNSNTYASSKYPNIVKIDRDNKGVYSYLKHIIDNYENLSEYTLFMRDNIQSSVESTNDYISRINTHLSSNTDFYQYNTVLIKGAPEQNVNIHVVNGYNADFDESEIYKNENAIILKSLVNKGVISPNEYYFIDNFRRNKPDKFAIRNACKRLNVYLPESYYCWYRASFIASRKVIIKRPKEFYINLRTWILEKYSNNYVLDAMWCLILQDEETLEYRSNVNIDNYE